MTSDLKRYLFVAAAMVIFLAAAQNAAGLNWRGSAQTVIVSLR